MMRHLTLALALAFALSPASRAATPAKPNVVLFLVDDLGWRDLGCYGSSFYETPNLDRFARENVRFTHIATPIPMSSTTCTSCGRMAAEHGRRPAADADG
jgi:arylsulfatase A-like enzyme